MNAPEFDEKTCLACGRRITWRKKWARDWASVRYCSHACRRRRVGSIDRALEELLLGEVSRTLNVPPFAAKATTLRRWAFARATSSSGSEPLFDDDAKLGVGGDWSVGGRVEGAFLSGVALAGRVLGLPHDDTLRP